MTTQFLVLEPHPPPPHPQATEGSKTKRIGLERGQVQQVVQEPKEKVNSFLYIFSDGSAVDNIKLLSAHRRAFRASDTQTHAGNSNSRCGTVASCRVSSSSSVGMCYRCKFYYKSVYFYRS